MAKAKKVNKTAKASKTAKVNKPAKKQSSETIRISRSDFAKLSGKSLNAIRHMIDRGRCAYTFKKEGREYYADIPAKEYKQLERGSKNKAGNLSRDTLFFQLKRYVSQIELVISQLEGLLKESSAEQKR